MDYDFITTCNWTSTGTFTLRAYRGSGTNVVTSYSLFYRKKGDSDWIETTNGQVVIASTGEWEIANDWNKSGNDVLTHSYYGITAINSCTDVYFNEEGLGTTVGTHFLYNTWFGCTSLTSMPLGFNLPTDITSVGTNFLHNTWRGCTNLSSMPSGFNLPSGITTVGDYFLYFTWYNCTSLSSMPLGFNLPTGITSVGNYFLYSAWGVCTSLTSMPSGFNIPSGITSVGDYFLDSTWHGCSSLSSMPSGFNVPTGITTVGVVFLGSTWYGCSSLSSMPMGFNLPSGITTVGDYFLNYAWYNCTNLKNDAYTEDITFEFSATEVFGGTCPIEPNSVTASKEEPVNVAVNRAREIDLSDQLNITEDTDVSVIEPPLSIKVEPEEIIGVMIY